SSGGSGGSGGTSGECPDPGTASAYANAVLASCPVAYWRLGEASGPTAKDEKGAYDGTYTGTPTFSDFGAIAEDDNTAVDFDGFSAVDVGQVLSFTDASHFTLEAWV